MVKCNNDQSRRLKRTLKREKNPTMRQRIQIVLLRESGMTQPEIAEAMGVSLSTVNRAHMAYDHGGRRALEPKPSGGRIRENMTLAEEKALLVRFAKAAGAGEMLNIHDLKAAYEKAIGHFADRTEPRSVWVKSLTSCRIRAKISSGRNMDYFHIASDLELLAGHRCHCHHWPPSGQNNEIFRYGIA